MNVRIKRTYLENVHPLSKARIKVKIRSMKARYGLHFIKNILYSLVPGHFTDTFIKVFSTKIMHV